MYRLLDLFSGIGGFSLGLERSGAFKTVAFCEIDPFCRRVLAKHWPHVSTHEDIRGLKVNEQVDAICGGFPCQPFSTASRGRRVATDLWPEMFRLIDECEPRYVVGENVQEEAIAHAAASLRGRGYGAYYRRISGADLGADHQRDRWWVCAYPNAQSKLPRAIDAEVAKLQAVCSGLWGAENYRRAVRVLDGLPARMDGRPAVEAFGNAVFPQIPEAFGRAIVAADR